MAKQNPPIKQKYIETPEKLWELFIAYEAHVKANPKIREDFVGKDATMVERKLERPLTFVGFECYLHEQDVVSNLSSYEANADNSYVSYLPILTRIKQFIETDQFEGATVGIYNHNIIARKLGLVDKQESKVESNIQITGMTIK